MSSLAGRSPLAPGNPRVLGTLLVVGATGLATLGAVVLGTASPAIALFPVVALTALYLALRTPLRISVGAFLFVLLTLDVSADSAGIWHTPLAPLGDLLHLNLDRFVPGLKFSGLELVVLFLLGLWAYRRATDSPLERHGRVETASVLRDFLLVYLVAFLYVEANGLARGSGAAIWKIRLLLHVPAFFLLFQAAFQGRRDFALLARIIVAAACLRAILAFHVQHFVAPQLTGGKLAYATNHGDSILFTVAAFILIVRVLERADRPAVLQAALLLPLVLLGMLENGRRLAWVMLVACLVAAYLLSPNRPWKRSFTRIALLSLPLVALYVGVGWNRGSALFRPVQTLRSVTDGSVDRSTLWREVENWNICRSIQESPILGIGLGGEYTEFHPNDDISVFFPEYRAWPHNSVLGLILLAGIVAFTAFWALHSIVVFLSVRSYRFATSPDDRAAALTCVAAVISCIAVAWGDTGPSLLQYRLFAGLAVAVSAKLAVSTGAWPARTRKRASLTRTSRLLYT